MVGNFLPYSVAKKLPRENDGSVDIESIGYFFSMIFFLLGIIYFIFFFPRTYRYYIKITERDTGKVYELHCNEANNSDLQRHSDEEVNFKQNGTRYIIKYATLEIKNDVRDNNKASVGC